MFRSIQLPDHGILLYESKHRGKDHVDKHHHAVHQILYAIEGEGTIVLDQNEHFIEQDHAIIVLPYSKHAIFSETKLTLLVLAFTIDRLDPFVKKELFPRFFEKSAVVHPHSFAASELRHSLRKMLFEQGNHDPLAQWALRLYLDEVLLSLSRVRQTTQPLDTNSLRAERIRNYIDSHYYESLSASDLADKLSISIRYLDAIFKDHYGITPLQYLTEVRMNRAKKLLAETDMDIASICFEIGYETISTFYRSFKNTVSLSPNKYRQLYQAGVEEFEVQTESEIE